MDELITGAKVEARVQRTVTEEKERPFTGMFFKGCFGAKTMLASGKKKRQKTLKKKRKVFLIQKRAENAGSHVVHYSVLDCRDKKALEAFNEMQEHIVKALRGEVEWFYNQD